MDIRLGEMNFLKSFEALFKPANKKVALHIPYDIPAYSLEKMGEGSYMLSFPVPGVNGDEISLYATDSHLTIEVNPHMLDKNYVHKNFQPKAWKYTFQLRNGMKPHLSYLKNGVLHIELFKLVDEKINKWQAKPYTPEIKLNFVPISTVANEA